MNVLILILMTVIIVLIGIVFVMLSTKSQCDEKILNLQKENNVLQNKIVDDSGVLYEHTKNIEMLSKLSIANNRIVHMNTSQEVFDEVINILEQLFTSKCIVIYMFDAKQKVFVLKKCYGIDIDIKTTLTMSDLQNNTLKKTSDEYTNLIFNARRTPSIFIRMLKDVKAGVDDLLFSQADLNVLDIFLNQCVVMLDKFEAYENMKILALTDRLTGLYNRHYAHDVIKLEAFRADRGNYPVSVIFNDVDNFKKVNDVYGHDVGDIVLQKVAHTIKEVVRQYDVCVRWGGEEFVVFLPQADVNTAVFIAERIRDTVSKVKFEFGNVTISLGIATYLPGQLNMDDVISNADKALYESKNTGKNKYTVFKEITN